MSRFFDKVEFDFSEASSGSYQKPENPKVIWDKEKLNSAYIEIAAEISRIKNGTSEYTTYPINPGPFGFPAENAIKIFISDPSDRAFEGIHAICRQDFSARAGDHFHKLLKSARREEKINDQ